MEKDKTDEEKVAAYMKKKKEQKHQKSLTTTAPKQGSQYATVRDLAQRPGNKVEITLIGKNFGPETVTSRERRLGDASSVLKVCFSMYSF